MILVFHGADTFRSRQKLREVLEKFRRDVDPQGYNITKLDGRATSCTALVGALSAAPFMARKRLVMVEYLSQLDFKKDEEETLVSVVKRLIESETVFVVWEEELGKTEWKAPVFVALKASPYVAEFASLDASQVSGYLRQRVAVAGVQFDASAWNYAAMSVEDDLFRAASEADKLIAFAQASGKTTLTLADVKPLMASAVRDDVFALVDAVSSGRQAQSLALLRDQLASGSHALEITTMLVRQYRLLQQVMDGLQQGLSPDRIASLYKMHPFVAKKMSGQARAVKPAQVKRAYDILTRLDRDLKGSGLPPDVLITAAVAQLAT